MENFFFCVLFPKKLKICLKMKKILIIKKKMLDIIKLW